MRFPSINVNFCLNLISQMGVIKRTQCCYCGNDNIAIGTEWVCFHCELLNNFTVLSMKLNDQELMGALASVNGKLAENDFDGAISEYKSIVDRYADPAYVYNYALLHIQYSNHVIASISYDKKGFMEENSVLREKGSSLTSKARLIFNKALSEYQKSVKAGTRNLLLDYVPFITNIKLGKPKMAMRAMSLMDEYSDPFVKSYCNMVYNAELGKYTETAHYAMELLKKGSFSTNALYYIAWALLKTGNKKDARKIIHALGNQFQNSSVLALAEAMEKSARH